jgi:hypothetical protein
MNFSALVEVTGDPPVIPPPPDFSFRTASSFVPQGSRS